VDGVVIVIRLSNIDRQLVYSYIREITMLGELIQGVEKQLASHAINDRRFDLLLGFTGMITTGRCSCSTRHKEIQEPQEARILDIMAPSLHQSGDVRYTGRITKQACQVISH
jgi:hypothetical protein